MINKNSWHYKLFRYENYGDPMPQFFTEEPQQISVCHYWASVIVFAPLCAFFSGAGWILEKTLGTLATFLFELKFKCPWGNVAFEEKK